MTYKLPKLLEAKLVRTSDNVEFDLLEELQKRDNHFRVSRISPNSTEPIVIEFELSTNENKIYLQNLTPLFPLEVYAKQGSNKLHYFIRGVESSPLQGHAKIHVAGTQVLEYYEKRANFKNLWGFLYTSKK